MSVRWTAISRALRETRHADILCLLAAYVVALSTIQVLVIGFSLFKIPVTQVIALIILSVSASCGFLQWRVLQRATFDDDDAAESTARGRGLAIAVVSVAVVLVFSRAVQMTLKPDFSWDGPAYHFPMMNFWAQSGYIDLVRPDPELGSEGISGWLRFTNRVFNGFPFGVEACAWTFVQAFDNSHLAAIGGFLYLPLAMLGIGYLARVLGVNAWLATAAAACFTVLPVTQQQLPTTLVDTAYAGTIIAMVALAVYIIRGFRRFRLPWLFAGPMGCAMGLVLGSKLSGPILAVFGGVWIAGLLVLVALCPAQFQTSMALEDNERIGRWRFLGRGIAFLTFIALCSIVVGGYWNIRNWVYHGNPMWPAKISIAGHVLFPHDLTMERDESNKKFPIVKLWLQGMPGRQEVNWPKSVKDFPNWYGGWGYLWLLGALPGIVYVLLHRTRLWWKDLRNKTPSQAGFELAWLLPLLFLGALALQLIPGSGRARYSYWVYGLGLPCFFFAVQKILSMPLSWRRLWRLPGRLWILACLAILVFEGTYCALWWGSKSYSYATGLGWPPFCQAPLRVMRTFYWYDPIGYIQPPLSCTVFDTILRSTDAVALHSMDEPVINLLLLGQVSEPIGARPVHFIGYELLNDEAALARQVKKHKLRYVILSCKTAIPEAAARLAFHVHEVSQSFWVLEFQPDLM
jgi:hypothetical protein